MSETRQPACPICGKPRAAEFRPFCSRRCAQVDLGKWFGEAYAVPGPPADADPEDGPASGDAPGPGR